MCEMCAGATIDDVRQRLHEKIVTDGFALVPVGGNGSDRGFAYTVGLVNSFMHPELVVVNHPLDEAVQVLYTLGKRVTGGSRLHAGDVVSCLGGEVALVDVHPAHFRRGLIAMWFDYYRAAQRLDLEPSALQVVLPTEHHCYEHQATQPRLDTEAHVPFGPTRAERRAQRSGKRRRQPRR